MITPNEWQWSRRSFTRQDQNADGQLTRRELTNAELSASPGATGTSGRSITVDAARGWVDSGIDVRSGDTLAGIVGGLLSRGADPLAALLWGVWLHGEAGRALASKVGPLGFLAREIAAEVPALLPTR